MVVMKIKYTAGTDIGKKYKHNEDNFFVPKSKKNVIHISTNSATYFILCDGMGGANSGEVASQLTVNWLAQSISDITNSKFRITKLLSKISINNKHNSLNSKIEHSIYEINAKIYELSQKHDQYTGMGTTLVTSVFWNNKLFLHSVGDSRCYRYRENDLQQLTEDQSEVWELYKMGAISKDDIRTHPRNNIITMSLGTAKNVKINSYDYDIQIDDIFLMCSDGLTDMISDQEIVEILKDKTSLDSASKELIYAALEAGGRDNVTVILIEVDK